MKNIWHIFIGDLEKIKNNTIAWIVIMGLTIVPSLYAWFNIAASWDPYGNTGNLKVAVANTDQGYEGDLFPLELNLGDTVVSSLRENTQMGWVFTDEESAVDGVQAGDYYAAIVIPPSFSRDMMSLFAEDVQRADIIYYLNEKENAIAPKITDKGASAVQKQIDEIFAKTVTEVGLKVTEGLRSVIGEDGASQAVENLTGNLSRAGDELSAASETIRAFSVMTGSLKEMTDTAGELLKGGQKTLDGSQNLLSEAAENLETLPELITGTSKAVSSALSETQKACRQLETEIDKAFASASGDVSEGAGQLKAVAADMAALRQGMSGFRGSLAKVSAALPDGADSAKKALNDLIGQLDDTIQRQQQMEAALKDAAQKMETMEADVSGYRSDLKKQMAEAEDAVAQLQKDYEENIEADLMDLVESLVQTAENTGGLLSQLEDTTGKIGQLAGETGADLAALQSVLEDSADQMDGAAKKLKSAASKLQNSDLSEALDSVKEIMENDPAAISSFMAAPVKLATTKFYPVDNYGSAMAPFYSVLSIWVGGTILVAMLKVNLDRKRREKLRNLKNYQLYLGRYLLFLIIGLLQSGLICLGDLYFLEIQCLHPWHFLMAGWFTSIVFVNILYTLTVSFGDVGKAICVVLMVIQVAGSGGTFPIEMTPAFFQRVYHLLPFTHAMAAMREAIAGFYGNTYWAELGYLSLFLAASLLLGLVLRRPIIRLNEAFNEKLESTKVI